MKQYSLNIAYIHSQIYCTLKHWSIYWRSSEKSEWVKKNWLTIRVAIIPKISLAFIFFRVSPTFNSSELSIFKNFANFVSVNTYLKIFIWLIVRRNKSIFCPNAIEIDQLDFSRPSSEDKVVCYQKRRKM